ncbi:MAG: SLC13 family permease [Caldilineaceae bacterium]
MIAGLTTPQLLFFIILISAFWLLFTEWLKNDVVAVLLILALALTGLLKPSEALSGFGSEPAIIAASIFVLSEALNQTGISQAIGDWIGRLAGGTYPRIVSTLMLTVAGLSAFTHHVTTTAMMLPVTLDLARARKIPASKLLIPLSFGASLGTTITIIGAPAFLVASATLQQAGLPGLGIFSITPMGLTLTVVGTLFMLLVGRFLLPSREGSVELGDRSHIDNYFTELKIQPSSPLVGKTLEEIKGTGHYHFTVVGWMRAKQHLSLPFAQWQLREGDVLLVHTTPDDLAAFRHEPGLEYHSVEQYQRTPQRNGNAGEQDAMVQAVVAPDAEFIGQSLREIDFRRRYGAIVIGFWRQGEFLQEELSRIPLRAGDVLVLQGDKEALARVEKDTAFLLLIPLDHQPRLRQKAPMVGAIVLMTILASALNLVTLDIAMLAGAAAVVLSGSLTLRQSYRAIDTSIYVFIAGAIPLGLAMQQTGTATLLAGFLEQGMHGWSQFSILLVLYTVVGLVTQLMSDAAAVALFAPVALALAQAMGARPEAYVVTVAMAAVTACLTPTGHHGNLLVYGPGRYQFVDFVRVGAPFTLCLALVVALMAPWLWPL